VAVSLWLVLLRRRLARKLQYVVVAFRRLRPLEHDDRARLRLPRAARRRRHAAARSAQSAAALLITAAIQVPVALVLSYYIAARTRVDRWQQP